MLETLAEILAREGSAFPTPDDQGVISDEEFHNLGIPLRFRCWVCGEFSTAAPDLLFDPHNEKHYCPKCASGYKEPEAQPDAPAIGCVMREEKCGCKIVGDGTLPFPLHIQYCTVHAVAKRLCKAVVEWARTPGNHGGNPYRHDFVQMADEALSPPDYKEEADAKAGYGPEPDEPEIDDRACCKKCGAPMEDGDYDDNHGYCDDCLEAAEQAGHPL